MFVGRDLPDVIESSKDSVPPDVALSMRQMQEQLDRVLNIVDTLKADNETLKVENDKLRAQTSLAVRGTEPTGAAMKPEVQIPVPPAPEAPPAPSPKPKRTARAAASADAAPAVDPDPAIPTPEQ